MSFVVQQNVVQFQISVNDALLMKEVQRDADFCCIKSVEKKSVLESSGSATSRLKLSTAGLKSCLQCCIMKIYEQL